MRWRKITLVGVGLLGGSLGLALRKRGLAGKVAGCVRREASIRECLEVGAVDEASLDLQRSVQDSDLVVLCTPLAQMTGLASSLAPALNPGTLVTDVGSVKAAVVAGLEPIFKKHGSIFIGSHPMAGSEKMGVAAARADLFEGAVCVVTPGKEAHAEDARPIEVLWESVGAKTIRLAPEEHDRLVARSSHLPHVLAAHLASYVLNPNAPALQARLCANGFRDCTRIASGSPEMWRDIVIANRENILECLREFGGGLRRFEEMLRQNDAAEIESFFSHAKNLRDGWPGGTASPSPE